MNNIDSNISHGRGIMAISPIMVFLLSYLVVSIVVGDFYKMPLSVALVISSIWAVIVTRGYSLGKRIEIFSKEAGSGNVMYMVWIFVLAGAFASLASSMGAVDATVNMALQILPAEFIVPGLFVAACFISMSIGTSVGTVVALAPLAQQLAVSGGGNVAFFVAVVLGGSFFGDNLSFISDTTIAATRTQGCKMNEKFKANLWIAMPAAALTMLFYLFVSAESCQPIGDLSVDYWLMLPYLVVIVLALVGLDVTIVLTLGILSALVIAIAECRDLMDLVGYMGAGIDSMGNLIIVTLLAAGMLGLIKAAGGINYILQRLTSRVSGCRGAQCCIAFLVSIVNVCTANNTVAIITVGSLSKSIADRYGVSARRSASLLDTCSCITQCLIPYGAQTLLATALAGISPIAPFQYLVYPWALMIMVVVSILLSRSCKSCGAFL